MFVLPGDMEAESLDCDVAIIGTGAAGLTLADALEDGQRRIVLIEAGGFDVTDAAQGLFDARSVGVPVAAHEGRYRVFGGTTIAWTGRCAPLDPLDLAARTWVADSGWPIAWADLARYYPAAAAACGFDEVGETLPPALERVGALPGRPDMIEPFVWRFWGTGRETYQHWGQRHYRRLQQSPTTRVLIGTHAVGVDSDDAGHGVRQVRARSAAGTTIAIRARQVVLCCGGIENARLLLNIADDAPALLGDVAPVIGRYFMQHPRPATAEIASSGPQALRLQGALNRFKRPSGLQFETGLAIGAAAQAEGELLNVSAVLRYRPRGAAGWRPDRLAARAIRRLRGREPRFTAVDAALILDLEQRPDRDSRIYLSDERDAIGLRKAVLDWRIDEAERRTSAAFTTAICDWIERAALGTAYPIEALAEDGGLRPEAMAESYHHIGATRMAADARTGVVDGDLRVHGTRNLFVCGASVMPTGGHANPTLTIVALALRLAETLRKSNG